LESSRPKSKWISRSRLVVQFGFFLLFNGAVLGLPRTTFTLPVLQSLGSEGRTVIDALDALQIMLSWPSFPWIPISAFMLSGLLLGRTSCGWACPFGFLTDLMAVLREKHMQVSLRLHNQAVNFKYGILAVTLFISGTLAISLAAGTGRAYQTALGLFAGAPFSALSPAGTILGVVPSTIKTAVAALAFITSPEGMWQGLRSVSPLLVIRLWILILIFAASIFIERFWCRYLCPSGAFLAVFSRFGFLGLRRSPLLCDKCGDCMKRCPMLIRIVDKPWEKMLDSECIMCLECMEACPHNAIKPTFP